MKQAEYNTGEGVLVLDVHKENKDGTLELGYTPEKAPDAEEDPKPVLKVGKCPQHPALKVGTARIIAAPEPAAEDSKGKKEDKKEEKKGKKSDGE